MLEIKRCVKLLTAWRGWMEREVQREAESFGESGALRHVSAPPPLRSIRAAIAPPSALKSYWLSWSQLLGLGQERERDAVKQKLLQDSFFITIRFNIARKKADIPSESRCLAPVVLLRLETHPPRGRSRSRRGTKVRRPSSNLPARALHRDARQHRPVPKARVSANKPETHPDSF